MNNPQIRGKAPSVYLAVDPGICGFPCKIRVWKLRTQRVYVSITSECKLVRSFSELINNLEMRDLFKPISRNPFFLSAEAAVCHISCPIPFAAVKASEVALEVALPRDVLIKFQPKKLEDQ